MNSHLGGFASCSFLNGRRWPSQGRSFEGEFECRKLRSVITRRAGCDPEALPQFVERVSEDVKRSDGDADDLVEGIFSFRLVDSLLALTVRHLHCDELTELKALRCGELAQILR